MSKLEQVFEQAWSEMTSGGASLDEVLSRFPEHDHELREMLEAAIWLRGAPQIEAPEEIRTIGRRRLAAHMAASPRNGAARPSLLETLFKRRLAPALAGLALVLTVATAAAQAAGPGDLLYRWRQASEAARLTISPDQTETASAIADRRALDLLQGVAGTREFELAAEAYQNWIERIVERGLLNDRIEQTLVTHQRMFEEQGIDVPLLQVLLDAEEPQEILPTPDGTVPALPTLDPGLPDPLDLLD